MKLAYLMAPAVAMGSVLKQSEGESPVKRVIGLLEKMKNELQAEADKDASLYDQMVCWCETSEKEKTLAVANAEATIKDLQSEIEGRSARFGELATDIGAMKKQIAEDTAALKEATAMREKEAANFMQSEKETVQAITNLKNAIRVLGKHNGGSLVQLSAPEMSGLRVVLRDVALKLEIMRAKEPQRQHLSLLSLVTKTENAADSSENAGSSLSRELLSSLDASQDMEEQLPLKFAEKVLAQSAQSADKPTSFLQASAEKQPTGMKSYNSASGPIFGILEQMLDEFNADLKSSQKTDAQAATDFAALDAAKKEQISSGKQKLDELEGEHAGNQKALADAKENIQSTTDQRAADVEFLRNLKLTCNDLDAQWEERSKMRSEEITAVAETIKILTDDDNAEQLKAGGVFAQGASFIQVETESAAMRVRRSKAAQALRNAAGAPEFDSDDLLAAWRSRKQPVSLGAAAGPRAQLSTLAISMSLDSFTKVKELMDKLVVELKDQQEEEVKFKAYCIKELDENEKATFHKSEEKEDHETNIKKLNALMEKLAGEIKDAQDQIAATQLEVKKASQDREDENAQFQQVVSDQRATQGILQKALQRLKDFYAKRLSSLAQVSVQQTPPVHFKPMSKSAGASPVMGLIEQIVEDSKALEKEAIAAEYQAQADYEKMVKDSNGVVKDLEDAITTKSKASAQAKIDNDTATADLGMANDELESLAAYEADLHSQCDFVLKNFDIRQKARLQEIEAIGEAKAIISGAK